jgi:hypothetical protein
MYYFQGWVYCGEDRIRTDMILLQLSLCLLSTVIGDIFFIYYASNACIRKVHRHYYRHITAKTIFAPTFTPTKQHQPSAFTDQLQIDHLPKIIPKERRTGEKGITHYYI